MTVPPVVDVPWLQQNHSNVKIICVSSTLPSLENSKEFREKHYGKFKELMEEKAKNVPTELIPGSVFFDLAVAYYPGETQRFALYPHDLFQEYIRFLGIDFYDHVIVYSRGPAAGMLFASRAWWTFLLYGHKNVSVLTGGFDAWKNSGLPVVNEMAKVKPGNWTAKPIDHNIIASFEELDFEHLDQINYLDAREQAQFIGEQPLGFPAPDATGSHIHYAKNLPLIEIMTSTGLKSKGEIEKALEATGYKTNQPTVTACNGGIQACLLALGFFTAGITCKVFNGSMFEVAARASKFINEK